MAPEAAPVGHVGAERGMRRIRVLADMAGSAATTTIASDVQDPVRLRLAEVAAGTLFAEHRIRDGMPERLQVPGARSTGMAVDHGACRVDNAPTGVHQTVHDRVDAVTVTLATGLPRIGEIAGYCQQADVRIVLVWRGGVTCMTDCAARRCKTVTRREALLLARMTTDTGRSRRLLRRCRRRLARAGEQRSDQPERRCQRSLAHRLVRQHSKLRDGACKTASFSPVPYHHQVT